MRKWIIGAAIVVGGILLFSAGYFLRLFDGFVLGSRTLVRVNGVEVTEADLKREIQFLRVNPGMPLADVAREDILDRLINDMLVLQEAKRLNVSISDEAVDAELTKMLSEYGTNNQDMYKNFRLSPARMRDLMRRQMLVEATVNLAVESKIEIKREDVEAYYWTHLLEFYQPAAVRARQIIVDTQAQADTLVKKNREGERFASLAEKYSRGPEKDRGGELGWVAAEDLPKSFTQALFKLQPGQISPVIETEYGFHIFMVDETRGGGKIPLAEAQTGIERTLRTAKTDRAFQEWLEGLRAEARIEIKHR
jgi:peptidyl-prolyl cis-trans isomerase C